jgi:protease-4
MAGEATMKKTLLLAVGAAAFLGACSPQFHFDLLGKDKIQEVVLLDGAGPDKILMIDVSGTIASTVDAGFPAREGDLVSRVYARLRKAARDPLVKGVILRLDTPGGEVTASDIVYHEVLRYRELTRRPVVGLMMGVAASGGYYIASACDRIIAHPTAVTGSIGVISVFPDAHELMAKVGVKVNVIKSRDFKDAGGPFREMTEKERRVFQGLIDEYYEAFLAVVLKGRRGTVSMEELRVLADGRVWTARQALALKLVDGLGYFEDALREAERLAGTRNASLVSYTYFPKSESNIYATAPATPALGLPAAGRAAETLLASLKSGFYYLWLPDLR